MRPFKTVEPLKVHFFGHSERVQIASKSKTGAFKNKKLIVIIKDSPSGPNSAEKKKNVLKQPVINSLSPGLFDGKVWCAWPNDNNAFGARIME